jgi:hypothetical protein
VYRPTYGAKRYRHPLAGELVLGFEAFTPAGDTGHTLGLFTQLRRSRLGGVDPGGQPRERSAVAARARRCQWDPYRCAELTRCG